MEENSNPALAAFLGSFAAERVWAQLLVRRTGDAFNLRHVADREAGSLRPIALGDLRKLSLSNEQGQFRPLKSAPDLPRGWQLDCPSAAQLWRALQDLYPGSVPDWYAARSGPAPVTDYREFTGRQTGMYRVTQLHDDRQAARLVAACCAPHLCLKQRLWTVVGLAPDPRETKSDLPCLEPCALLLELARKSARIEQEDKRAIQLPPSDLDTVQAAIRYLAGNPPPGIRTGDLASPLNPRRLQLLSEKLQEEIKSK